MDVEKLELSNLPINLISFIFQYLPTKNIFEVSLVSKKFRKAFFQDYIWENIAKNDELFLPEEGKNFSGWKNYFNYLKELGNNLKNNTKKKNFHMIPYRGHKKVVNAIECILLDNAYDYIIISGDEEGKVFTWNLELDEDDDLVQTKDLIVDTKSKILGIKNFENYKQILIWNEDWNFYVYNYNNRIDNSIKKNSERFQEIFKSNLTQKEYYTYISYNPEEQCVYLCKNFNDPFIVKSNKNDILKFNLLKNNVSLLKITMEFNQICKIRNNEIIKDNNNNVNCLSFLNKEANIPFVENDNFVIVYLNYDFIKGNLLYLYNKETDQNKLYNIRLFKKSTNAEYRSYIQFDIIFSINKMENDNNQIGILGIFKNKLYYKIYSILNINLKLKTEFLIDNNPNIFNFYSNIPNINKKIDILNLSKNSISYLLNMNELYTYNFEKKEKKFIQLDCKNNQINCFIADKFRIVIGFNNNLLSIYSKETGNLYFNLLGGSLTVIPKSFVAKPNFTGFHLIKITRTAIIGVLGNLIRVYSFKPK